MISQWIPRFREEKILREQLKLVHKNYILVMSGFWGGTSIAGLLVFFSAKDYRIFAWLMCTTAITVYSILHHFKINNLNYKPLEEAKHQVYILLIMGLLVAILPIIFLNPDSSPILIVNITILVAGICAGALTMQAPCLPIFLAFLFTSIPGLAISFIEFKWDLIGLIVGCFLYIPVMLACAYNMESIIKNSIELQFSNFELIGQLREAISRTEKANRDKSVFLASASHDLRQPLHAMGLFIESMANTSLNPEQTGILSQINLASDATRDMLNTLLNFSKLDAGVIEPNFEPVDLQAIFGKLEKELASTADSKNIVYRCKETSAVVHSDSTLLELILRNLISNAIRYTYKGGVLIACRKTNTHYASIEVWDTGIGIKEIQHENIFKEFYQLNNPERDRQKGFGLGLAIVKGLSEKLNIDVQLRSRPSQGTVFKINVPLSKHQLVHDPKISSSKVLQPGLKILFIDDDESIRAAMKNLIESWHGECWLADSEVEAIDILNGKRQAPDLVIADYRLRKNKTGGQAIHKVRAHINKHLPAIIITGDTASDRLREAKQQDAELLHKPVVVEDLKRTISGLLY